MSAELEIDDRAVRLRSAVPAEVPDSEPLDARRPNVSGDLPTLFSAPPMFRRSVIGYDRFQVDTYVQWAEDELASAERAHERLVARHLRTQADLDEARELLAHSPEGGELLGTSRRIGALLAAAADEAETIRAEAETRRRAATAEATRKLGYARWRIGYAEAKAQRLVTDASAEAEDLLAGARRIVDEADRVRQDARIEAGARLERARADLRLADEDAARIREDARDEARAARLHARGDVVRVLTKGREQRRRADAEAAAVRERLAQEAAGRYTSLLDEVTALEHRRASLRAEIDLLADASARSAGPGLGVQLGRFLSRYRWRTRALRAP